MLLDLQRLAGEDLPPDNVLSVLARAHGLKEVGDVSAAVDEIFRVMRGPQRGELRDVMLRWLNMLGTRLGLDLSALEDRQVQEQLERSGQVRLLVEERLRAQLDGMKARSLEQGLEQGLERGLEQGLERQRDLLRRLTVRKFGEDTAAHLGPLLAAIKDPEFLASVGEWIIDCPTGSQLLAKLRSTE